MDQYDRSGIAPETLQLLVKTGQTMGLFLGWLMANAFAGLGFGWAIIQEKLSLGNILFYVWFIASFIAIIVVLKRMWATEWNKNKNRP